MRYRPGTVVSTGRVGTTLGALTTTDPYEGFRPGTDERGPMAGSSGGSEPTFYETLGVGEDASVAEIRAAYRERAKDTHPDVSDAPDARRRFRRVKRARDVLADEGERRRYDRLGHEAYVALDDPGPSGDADRSDAAAGRTAGSRTGGEHSGAASGRGGRDTNARGRSDSGPRGRSGAGPRSRREAGSADTSTAEADPFGRVAYGLARWLRLAGGLVDAWQSRLGPAGAAIALATFAAYPVLLASTVTPLFPLAVNLLVGTCTFAILGYLVLRPAIGIAVLGAWLLVLPVALTVSGIGIVSPGGIYSLVLTVVPLTLCVATLAGASGRP